MRVKKKKKKVQKIKLKNLKKAAEFKIVFARN
jgi:hypothetical protein